MILIADSGSSKTTWCVLSENETLTCETAGLNPFHQSGDEILESLQHEFQLTRGHFDAIYFYGAGCANQEKSKIIEISLGRFFDSAEIFAKSDLMAAARSLCGSNPGLAAIIGTGSNSCYYDGYKIKRHVPPLGYILGDEGSGTVLGRKLISDILKNQLPREITSSFYKKYNLAPDEILEYVYRKPFPNRFMARFTRFIAEHIDHPSIYNLVMEGFREFFSRNISQYPEAASMPVNITGGVGWCFRDILSEAASDTGFSTGIITRMPMEGLVKYHKKQLQE